MGSPVPSFDSQWGLFEDGSQQYIQIGNLALNRPASWNLLYIIECKLIVNNRLIMPKITEPKLALAPANY